MEEIERIRTQGDKRGGAIKGGGVLMTCRGSGANYLIGVV